MVLLEEDSSGGSFVKSIIVMCKSSYFDSIHSLPLASNSSTELVIEFEIFFIKQLHEFERDMMEELKEEEVAEEDIHSHYVSMFSGFTEF